MHTFLISLPWWKPEPLRIPLPELGGILPSHVPVEPFGILVMTAVLLGVLVARRRGSAVGIDPRVLSELLGYMLISGFVLGHMLDALAYHYDLVRLNPWLILDPRQGLSSFGGVFGAVLGGLVWARRRGYPLLPFADVVAYAFPFGWLFGRLGCSVAHDHPGRVTDFPLAIESYHIRGHQPPWLTRHDLGLYEALFTLLLIALFLLVRRRGVRPGMFVALLPLSYAPVRFGLDFLRATDIPRSDPRWLGLTPGHYAAILTFAGGIALLHRVRYGPPITVPEGAALPGNEEERGEEAPVPPYP